jgi:hypothetical protein
VQRAEAQIPIVLIRLKGVTAMAIHMRVVYAATLVFILLIVSNAPAAQVQFAWDLPTNAGDDSMIMAGYRLYYGAYDIEGVIDVGDQPVYTMTGLEPGKTYFFAVTAYDSSGNETEFSNVLVTTIPDARADMEASQADAGQSPASGTHGTFADPDGGGLAREKEEAPGRAAGHSDETGADLSRPGDPDRPSSMTWTNYRLSLTIGSEHHDDIGIMFRYQDQDNYYRFLWNNQDGYRRLEKQENGVFMLLAEDTSLSTPMQPYELTVVAADEALQIWINDALIFSITDDSLLSGSIALYAAGMGENYFDNILVEDLDTDSVLLWDDFNNSMFADWMIVDEGMMVDSSEWSAEAGVLVQRADLDAEIVDRSDLAHHGTFALYMP